jgi:hypothetical protein
MLTSNRTVRQTSMRIFWLGIALAMPLLVILQAADISGKWTFSVDLEDGGHGDPTFVLKQESGKLTGTYDGPLGERNVSGTVTGEVAQFGFSMERDGETVKVTYTAKIESPVKMSGTVKLEGSGGGGSGKWTAVKQ